MSKHRAETLKSSRSVPYNAKLRHPQEGVARNKQYFSAMFPLLTVRNAPSTIANINKPVVDALRVRVYGELEANLNC